MARARGVSTRMEIYDCTVLETVHEAVMVVSTDRMMMMNIVWLMVVILCYYVESNLV